VLKLEVMLPGARGILARPSRSFSRVGLGADSPVVLEYQAELQGRINALGSQGAATLQSATGIDVTQGRVASGAAAALSLAQGGFDPTSSDDEGKLVAAISGGLCLIPAVGPILGASVEGLYQVGEAISCPLMKVVSSLGIGPLPPACGGSACTTSSNWTTAGVLSNNVRALPSRPQGSFQELVVSALASFASSAANCKATLPPGVIVDAAVKIWNQTHAGPAVAYLVPPLNQINQGIVAFGDPSSILTTWPTVSGPGPAEQAGKDPYAYYAFQPLSSIPSSEHPNLSAGGQLWPIAPPPAGSNVDPPRIVMVNTGALLTPTTTTSSGQPFGIPPLATSFQPNRIYLVSQIVPGADAKTGQPATAGQPVMAEAAFLEWAKLVGFTNVQILWWGPTSTTDDPSGYLESGWFGPLWVMGRAAKSVGGLCIMLALYTGSGVSVPQGVSAYDVTGSVIPRATVLPSTGSTAGTLALATVGTVAAVGAAGSLYALITKQAIGYFWGKVFDQIVDGGKSLYRRVTD